MMRMGTGVAAGALISGGGSGGVTRPIVLLQHLLRGLLGVCLRRGTLVVMGEEESRTVSR